MAEKLSYRPAEAIEATGLRRSHLYELLASGELPSYKVGRARLIDAADLAAFLQRRRAAAEA